MWRTSIGGSQGQPIYFQTQVIEEVGSIPQISSDKGQGIVIVTDAETIGAGPAGTDRPESGKASGVMAQVIEEVGSIPQISSDKGQGIVVVTNAKAVSAGTAGTDVTFLG